MSEAYKLLVGFLEQHNFGKAAKALREDIENQEKTKAANIDPEATKNIFRLINKALVNQSTQERKNKNRETDQHEMRKPPIKLFTPEETENIMEKFMNRLVAKPNLLEDENLNARIEKFFDNQTFQKMVEGIDVFQDISNISFTNSLFQKNKGNEAPMQKVPYTDSSIDLDGGVPRFGKADSVMLTNEESLLNSKKMPQKENVPKSGKDNDFGKTMEKSPSMGDIFDNMDMSANKNKEFGKSGETTPPMGFEKNKPGISIIEQENSQTSFFRDSSLLLPALDDNVVDEYTDDDDPGFDLYEVSEKDFPRVAKQLADKYGFPGRAVSKDNNPQTGKGDNKYKDATDDDSVAMLKEIQDKKTGEEGKDKNNDSFTGTDGKKGDKKGDSKSQKKARSYIFLPSHLKHPTSNDEFYPVEYDNVIFDCFNLKVIFDRERTGFEETKDFPIVINSIIAGRYQILEYLGSAAFSKAIQCLDLTNNQMVCMKIIENNKDYFDQSIDEIKLLKFINNNGDVDEKNVLKVYDHFYHKEHLFIVTELLKDNLYEFSKYNRENETDPYFSVGRLQKITKQILVGLDYIHSLSLIHCDLKPENILMKSYNKGEVKIIDFGSSCFIHDHLSSYVQSRSYRAPEVIIGCKYDYKIDIWSLGCILAELWTGNVLFQNDTVQGLLARVIGIAGAFPEKMMRDGRLVGNFFTKERLLYQEQVLDEGDQSQGAVDTSEVQRKGRRTGKVQILVPKKSSLKHRMRTNDAFFLDFVRRLLEIDPAKRPTAKEALAHPWISEQKYPEVPYQAQNGR